MAEFAYINSIHSSIRYSPFFANTGYHPRWMMLEHSDISNNPTVHERLLQLKDIQAKLSDHLHHTQASYKKAADRHRLDSGSKVQPKFQIRDCVWLL
jgi:hypothetical protein